MLFFKVMCLCNAYASNDKVLACRVLERINNKNNNNLFNKKQRSQIMLPAISRAILGG